MAERQSWKTGMGRLQGAEPLSQSENAELAKFLLGRLRLLGNGAVDVQESLEGCIRSTKDRQLHVARTLCTTRLRIGGVFLLVKAVLLPRGEGEGALCDGPCDQVNAHPPQSQEDVETELFDD